jgi:O-glycosyl hydrolase
MRLFFLIVLLTVLYTSSPAQPVYNTRVIPDPQQEIRGFGVFAGQLENGSFCLLDQPEIRKAIYGELGISVVRVQLIPSFYKAETGGLDFQQIDKLLIRQLEQLGEYGLDSNYITSIWSPPPSMKTCPTTSGTCENGAPNFLQESAEEDYVKFISEIFLYLRSKGMRLPRYHSIQNEISYAPQWNGCVYGPEQWQRVLRKMRDGFNANGLREIGLIGPENTAYSAAINFLGGRNFKLLDNKETAGLIGAVAVHGYGKGSWNSEAGKYATLMRNGLQKADRLGFECWMTEWSLPEGKNEHEMSMNALRKFSRENVYVPFQYWLWWMGWRNHFSNEELMYGEGDALHKTPLYHAFRHIWNTVKPGYRVKHLMTDDPDLNAFDPNYVDMVAWDSPRHLVVLIVNHTAAEKRMNIQGLPGKNLEIRYVNDNRHGDDPEIMQIVSGEARRVPVPGKTIVIIKTDVGGLQAEEEKITAE